MTTLQNKLDNIYQTKLEIKSAIGTDSDVFSEYPALIRNMGGGGVSYSYLDERLSYYVETADLEAMGYVTYTYADSQYISYGYIDDLTYISEYILGPSDPSSPENVYATKYELGSYVSYTYLENKKYATESYVTNAISNIPSVDTSSYVTYTYLESKEYITEIPNTYATYAAIEGMGYVTSNELPVINENILPKENNTYTLGDASHLYSASYITDLWTGAKNRISNRSDNQINIQLNNGWKYTFHSNGFSCATGGMDLGNVTPWRSTYTSTLYADNTYTSNIYTNSNGSNKIYDNGAGRICVSVNNYQGFRFGPSQFYPAGDYSLGTNDNKWGSAYITNAYISNSTYLPVATYWYDGSTYHWLGTLFS